MKKNILALALAAGLISFAGYSTLNAKSDPNPLDGIWINTDAATRSFGKVEITGTQIVVTPSGENTKPQPLTLQLLGDSVSDISPNKYGYVSEDVGFANYVMTVKRTGEQLMLQTLTFFKDSSGRTNYQSTDIFKQQSTTLKDAVDESGNRLSLVSLSVPPNQVLKGGERVTATIRYKAVSSKKVRIWVHTTGAQFFEPSGSLGEEGEITRFFGSSIPAKADKIVVSMVEVLDSNENGKEILHMEVDAKYEWVGYEPGEEPVAVIGQPFPELKFKSTDGREVDVSTLKGKVVLIDFWATWCGPCKAAMPEVRKAYETYRDSGFEVIGISLDDNLAALDRYVKKEGITWPQYFDGKGWKNQVADRFHVHSIPRFFLLDRNGVTQYDSIKGEKSLTEVVRQLCAAPPLKP